MRWKYVQFRIIVAALYTNSIRLKIPVDGINAPGLYTYIAVRCHIDSVTAGVFNFGSCKTVKSIIASADIAAIIVAIENAIYVTKMHAIAQ